MTSHIGQISYSDRPDNRSTASVWTVLAMSVLLMSGCSALVSRATGDLTNNLALAITNNNDLATVETGGPAYLLMIDGMVNGDPDNPVLLAQASTMHSTYAGAFVRDTARARKMSAKALAYGQRSVCALESNYCSLRSRPFSSFMKHIARMRADDVPAFFSLGAAWAAWIQLNTDDFNALAELARIEAIMQRIVELNEAYMQGSAHLYLGTLAISLPPALGGQPKVAQTHFERAIELSAGRNLMAKVLYARQYARMVYDRKLHDRLLNEVLSADPDQSGFVLINTLAQEQAQQLLVDAADYF